MKEMISINVQDFDMKKKVTEYMKRVITKQIRMEPSEMEDEVLFDDYGIDSLYAIEIRKELKKTFGKLPATLFFDYNTVSKLADYFIKNHYIKLAEVLGFSADEQKSLEGIEHEKLIREEIEKEIEIENETDRRPEKAVAESLYTESIEREETVESAATSFRENEVDSDDIFVEDRADYEPSSTVKAVSESAFVSRNEPETHQEEKKESENSPESKIQDNKKTTESVPAHEVAVVGISGRYPMAENVDEFWTNLKSGKNCITEIPKDRWDYREYYFGQNNPQNIVCTKWGGFIKDMDKFDSLFFHIAPSEAEKLDPQERIFLETVWSAVEDAGLPEEAFATGNHAGLYVGVMNKDYELIGAEKATPGRASDFRSYYWSFANRVSYALNMQGPSMAVDTACSASLAAIHLASESIRTGECELAVAGGVNLILHPSHMEMLSNNHMLSAKDKCMSFSEEGDGIVLGEGCGAVVLKDLSQAVQDGDHIYGVIKASCMNACGNYNHYMVQNPETQAELIYQVYQKAGIAPESISYMEAQATGSHLGDAKEMASANQAFSRLTSARKFCAVGSVKSNIGHLESASGVAALTKVLLQMKHKQLVPTIHAENPNKEIDFENSCFYLQTELCQWTCLYNEKTKEKLPRRAGISSFGAGGSDVHIIVEEFNQQTDTEYEVKAESRIIVLSAKNEDRLKQKAKDLAVFLEQNQVSLTDLSYTLLTGRRNMEQRLAFVASSIEEVKEVLADYLADEKTEKQYFLGNIKKTEIRNYFRSGDRASREYVRILIEDGEIESLAGLWTEGITIDWSMLFKGYQPKRISLPAYPFLRKRYWRTIEAKETGAGYQKQVCVEHPLVENVSSFDEVCYQSRLMADMDVVRDHVVKGQHIVPTALLVNIIIKAGRAALSKKQVGVRDMLLLAPICVEQAEKLVKVFFNKNESKIKFELKDNNGTLCIKGNIVSGLEVSRKVAIDALKERLDGTLTRQQCYEIYQKMGFAYGPMYQSLEKVFYNKQEAVAKLHIPTGDEEAFQKFVIHPAVLDGMIQSVAGILYANDEWNVTYLPFAIGQISLLEEITGTDFYVHIVRKDVKTGVSRIHYYDLSLYLPDGTLAAVMKDYAGKLVNTKETSVDADRKTEAVSILEPVWTEKEMKNVSDCQNSSVMLIEHKEQVRSKEDFSSQIASRIKEGKERNRFVYLCESEPAKKLVGRFAAFLQALQTTGWKKEIYVVCAYCGHRNALEACGFEALAGLARTVMAENRRIHIKFVMNEEVWDAWKDTLKLEVLEDVFEDLMVDYRSEKRYVEQLKNANELCLTDQNVFRQNGVYLITGGLGGVGRQIARYITDQTSSVVILTGRRKNADRDLPGEQLVYECCDCSKEEDVKALVQKEVQKYGHLDGIIHAAGIVNDKLFVRKTEEEFQAVCAPKIDGVTYLDRETKDIKLDFFVCCSSISAILGNAGQADYAYANAYMDSYMAKRAGLEQAGTRYGKSISINWPYWQEGGMEVPEQIKQQVYESTGLCGMDTSTGLKAIGTAILSNKSNLCIATGDVQKIQDTFHIAEKYEQSEKTIPSVDPQVLMKNAEEKIIEICAQILKVDENDLDVEEELDNYGLDSIMMIAFMQKLEEGFDTILEPNLLANENTILKLASYFCKNGICQETDTKQETKEITMAESVRKPEETSKVYPLEFSTVQAVTSQEKQVRDNRVAVIGMSCRFPKSPTLEKYWENLIAGNNMISEVTDERWDISKYYSEKKGEPNKSYTKYAGLIDDVYGFDAEYFGISEQEAKTIDPYHRILLELSDELFKRAGYQKSELNGSRTGVFIGSGESNYFHKTFDDLPEEYVRHIIVNTIPNMMAARISDYYNLKGPAECVDTACSSSMTALHHACQEMQAGDCDMALVGGVELILNEYYHVAFSKAGILTQGEKAYVFDERADGTVLGEGAGLLLLKPYQKAVEDGDRIEAVIYASALNNDGHTMGLTVPSLEGQKEVIAQAIQKSGISPRNITYLETHGTGTLLGDPIEMKAATDAFRKYTDEKQFCAVGSVKSNMGHLLRAAGVAGMIKIILALQNKMLPPTLNCTRPHPRFQFPKSPFYPILEAKRWEAGEQGRYAAISAFGFGGTNAHAILGEFKEPEGYVKRRKPIELTHFHKKQFCIYKKEEKLKLLKENTYEYGEDYVKDHLGENPFDNMEKKPHVLFGVTHFSMALDAAADLCSEKETVHVKKLFLQTPITLYEGETAKIALYGKEEKEGAIKLYSKFGKNGQNTEEVSAEGTIRNESGYHQPRVNSQYMLDQYRVTIQNEAIYSGTEASRGDSLKTVRKLYVGEEKAAGELRLKEEMLADNRNYKVHPALLDAGFVVCMKGVQKNSLHTGRKPGVWIPVMAKEIYMYQQVPAKCMCQAELVSIKNDMVSFNLTYFNEEGRVLLEVKEFSSKYVYYKQQAEEREALECAAIKATPEIQPKISAEYEGKKDIAEYLKDKIASHLNQDKVEVNEETNFMELGIDSTSLIYLAEEIEKEAGIELYPTIFFEYQNIGEMAEYLEAEHKEAFEQFLGSRQQTEKIQKTLEVKPEVTDGPSEKCDGKESLRYNEPVAVIGMNGRFPGGKNLSEFWETIRDSKSMITKIPENHWDVDAWYSEDRSKENCTYSKWGSFIEPGTFDPAFFGISPREAVWLDPQLRQLMEVVYSALEDAGYSAKIKGTNTGVFVGSCLRDYWDEVVRRHIPISDYQGNSSLASSLSGRLSYLFDLHGMSMNVDNACASSLSAIHLACKAIQNGSCDMAIAAGVNILVSPLHYLNASKAQALSPTGKCHSFDVDADGYVPGEGVGALILKPLSKAIKDRDQIHAIIKGTATNHNGKANNPTSPRTELQVKLLLDAWKNAQIEPETISYMEAHGTGTILGDPIEIDAMNQAFRNYTSREHFCAVGTIKSNLGHLEGAAGIAGVMKTILSMKHKTIVKMPEYHKANPYLKLEHAPVYINEESKYWDTKPGVPRRAGVSAFGLTGNNTHIVLEEYQGNDNEGQDTERKEYAFVLSAKDQDRLTAYAERFAACAEQLKEQGIAMRDVCYTMAVKREPMEERFGCVVSDFTELKETLEVFLAGKEQNAKMPTDKKTANLLEAWLSGKNVDWEEVYSKKAHVVSLPTYPFAKEYYWMPQEKKNSYEKTESAGNPDVIYMDSIWEEHPLAGKKADELNHVLILDGRGSYPLTGQNDNVAVRFGDGFAKRDREYTVTRGKLEDYKQLSETLNRENIKIERVIYFPAQPKTAEDGKQCIRDVYDVIMGMQEQKRSELKNLSIVYQGKAGIEMAGIEALGGYCLSLGNVLPQMKSKLIELDEWCGYKEALAIVSREANADNTLVRYQAGARMIAQMQSVDVEKSGKTLFRRGGSYLITGGAGGLGSIFAKTLYETTKGHIILLGRSKLQGIRAERFDNLKQQGIDVVYYAVDVTDAEAVSKVAYAERAAGHQINGVIHAAGIPSGDSMLEKSEEEFFAVQKPKVDGLIALDKAFEKESLDFFCVFSSNAAIFGDSGQCDYSVANRFADCFMEQRQRLVENGERTGKSVVIDWPLWRDGGMHLAEEVEKLYLKSSGMYYLEEKDGVQAWKDLFESGRNRMSVVTAKKSTIQKILAKKEIKRAQEMSVERTEYREHTGKNESKDNTKRSKAFDYSETMKVDLIRMAAEAVEMDVAKVKRDELFGDMGFDSISMKDLAEKLSGYYQVTISPAVFFATGTVDSLYEYLKEHNKEAIDRFYTQVQDDIEQENLAEVKPAVESDGVEVAESTQKTYEDIAIIGAAGKLPGAEDLTEFWNNLVEEKDSITIIPKERWDYQEYYSETPYEENKTNSKWGGFIRGFDEFDAKYFNISKREAELMDPQHKIFLQTVYKAIEDAGYSTTEWSGKKVGVFGGIQFHDYERMLYDAGIYQVQTGTGNSAAMLCNRVSYLLNLNGPSEAVDTACSSSMTAIHKAVKAIQAGECETAIAGGVSLMLTPYSYLIANQTGALSPDGHCHTFDEEANGYVKGEGTGVVILKPLQKAKADGDSIYAVIKGSAENHGGKSNSPTAPNAQAQAEVIKNAYEAAQISPDTVSYIETHGTGTKLGDPVEIEGLKDAFHMLEQEFGVTEKKEAYCGLGAVKTNIGHLEPASGIASLLKVILAMKHKVLPATIHFKKLNPYIQLEQSPFYVVNETKEWKCRKDESGNEIPRRAGISSFGFGGSNVHMVVEEYREDVEMHRDGKEYVFEFSAKTKDSLKRYTKSFAAYLRKNRNANLSDVAYTLSEGRDLREIRLAVIAESAESLIEQLEEYSQYGEAEYANSGDEKVIAATGTHTKELEETAIAFLEGDTSYHNQFKYQTGRKRVHLPAYSFEPVKCWPKKLAKIDKKADIENLLYKPAWKKAGTTDSYQKPEKADRAFILYPESSGIMKDVLAEKLSGRVSDVQTLLVSELDKMDYECLSTGVSEIYFLGGTYEFEGRKLSAMEESQKNGIVALFRLVKQLQERGFRENSIILKLITENVYAVKEGEPVNPFDASMHGFLMSAAREYRNWKIYMADCGRADFVNRTSMEQTAEYLTGDFAAVTGQRVAVRNGNCYEMVIHPLTLTEKEEVPFRKNGVYMIFGGAGGIGIELAKYMAYTAGAKVALVGRSQPESEKSKRIHEIEQYGGQVMYVQADMTDVESTRQAVLQVKEKFGQINGVVHSALVLKDNIIENMNETSLLAVLAPKTTGTVVLDTVFQKEPLDFMMFFSAAQSFYGNAGQSNYAAACMFKDAYSRYMSENCHYQIKTVNWGFWGSVGVVASDNYRKKVGKQGAYSIEPSEGMEVIKQLLNHDENQILAIKADKKKLYQMIPIEDASKEKQDKTERIEQIERKDKTVLQAGQEQKLDESDIQKRIVDIIAQVLDVTPDEIDLEEAYESMGVDSLLAIEIIDKINKALGIHLKSTALFNFANVNMLLSHILENWKTELYKLQPERETKKKEEPKDREAEKLAEPPVTSTASHGEDKSKKVAIIGMSGKFPGVQDIDDLWEKLKAGFDGVSKITRWEEDDTYQAVKMKSSHTRWGAMLKDIDQFDPLFFNISPKEAEQMDPQQRIFMEETWKALEDAGYSGTEMEGQKCGVFLGYNGSSYYELIEKNEAEADSYAYLGNSEAIMASRISYFLNLKGPSLTINTACSSSLVAMHLARESILSGTSDMAVAGGVMIMVTPMFYKLADATGMLSSDGRCKAFDQSADGIAPGECVACVIMKRLDKAIQDGDHIYGVIEGTEMNQDGRTNGITAPSEPSQTALESAVYEKFQINPEKISYIEAHGTGTKLGDPIEMDALAAAFRKYTEKKRYCAVGSVKTNFGHSLAGAGITGIIKILLCMKYGQLVPSIHCEKENELLCLEDSPFYINKEWKKWNPTGGALRYAAISSFGLSGTNVHIVLREADETEQIKEKPNCRNKYLIPISARNEKVLGKKKDELLEWLKKDGQHINIRDISYTLLEGRSHFVYRMCFVAATVQELIEKLERAGKEDIVKIDRKREKQSRQELEQEEKILENDISDELLCQYYQNAYELDWSHYFKGDSVRRISLPTYPFDHKRYWIAAKKQENPMETFHPLIDGQVKGERGTYQIELAPNEFYLRDHVIMGKETLPGVVHVGIAKAAGELAAKKKIKRLSSIIWMSPVTVEKNKKLFVRLKEKEAGGGFEIYTEQGTKEILHTQGKYEFGTFTDSQKLSIEQIKERCIGKMTKEQCYQYFENSGTQYRRTFQSIVKVYKGEQEVLAHLQLSEEAVTCGRGMELHPSILDGAFQATIGMKDWITASEGEVFVPFSVTEIEVYGELPRNCYVFAKPSERNMDKEVRRFDLFITDEAGNVLVKMKEYTMRKMSQPKVKKEESKNNYMAEVLKELRDGKLTIDEVKQLAGGIGWKTN